MPSIAAAPFPYQFPAHGLALMVYECLLIEDATASYFPAFKQATLEMIRAQGAIVGWTATAADVLRALEQCAA